MRAPSRKRSRALKFGIMPLIDVVFLLIIFFLAASHFAQSETAEAVELPNASEIETEKPDEQLSRLVVTVTADGIYHVGGDVIERDVLAGRIRQGRAEHGEAFEVRIRADRSLEYRMVEPIMIASARSSVTNVKFAVIEK